MSGGQLIALRSVVVPKHEKLESDLPAHNCHMAEKDDAPSWERRSPKHVYGNFRKQTKQNLFELAESH